MNTEPRYRIHAVSEMTGIPAPTLRAWERRYGIPRPGRSESAYRLYSDADVAEVRQLVVLQTRGLAPSEAARLLLDGGGATVLEAAATSLPDVLDVRLVPGSDAPPRAFEVARHRIVAAVVAYDSLATEREVRAALYLGPPIEVYEGVLRPVLIEVGLRWQRGELDVAGEHLASRVIGAALADVTAALVRASEAPGFLLATALEDQHDLPLYGVAFAVFAAGLRPIILGQRTPPEAVAAAVSRLAPRGIGLSMTVSLPAELDADEVFRAYGAAAGALPWYVGGPAAAGYAPIIERAGGRYVPDAEALRRALDSAHRI